MQIHHIFENEDKVASEKCLEDLLEEIFQIRHVEKPSTALDFRHSVPDKQKCGTLLYFTKRGYEKDRLRKTFDLLGVPSDAKDYAVRVQRAESGDAGFITQLQFGRENFENNPEQPLSLIDAIDKFFEEELNSFGTERQIVDHFKENISGFCGDGSEYLANNLEGNDGTPILGFGFLVEDSRCHIYRLWSRIIYLGK